MDDEAQRSRRWDHNRRRWDKLREKRLAREEEKNIGRSEFVGSLSKGSGKGASKGAGKGSNGKSAKGSDKGSGNSNSKNAKGKGSGKGSGKGGGKDSGSKGNGKGSGKGTNSKGAGKKGDGKGGKGNDNNNAKGANVSAEEEHQRRAKLEKKEKYGKSLRKKIGEAFGKAAEAVDEDGAKGDARSKGDAASTNAADSTNSDSTKKESAPLSREKIDKVQDKLDEMMTGRKKKVVQMMDVSKKVERKNKRAWLREICEEKGIEVPMIHKKVKQEGQTGRFVMPGSLLDRLVSKQTGVRKNFSKQDRALIRSGMLSWDQLRREKFSLPQKWNKQLRKVFHERLVASKNVEWFDRGLRLVGLPRSAARVQLAEDLQKGRKKLLSKFAASETTELVKIVEEEEKEREFVREVVESERSGSNATTGSNTNATTTLMDGKTGIAGGVEEREEMDDSEEGSQSSEDQEASNSGDEVSSKCAEAEEEGSTHSDVPIVPAPREKRVDPIFVGVDSSIPVLMERSLERLETNYIDDTEMGQILQNVDAQCGEEAESEDSDSAEDTDSEDVGKDLGEGEVVGEGEQEGASSGEFKFKLSEEKIRRKQAKLKRKASQAKQVLQVLLRKSAANELENQYLADALSICFCSKWVLPGLNDPLLYKIFDRVFRSAYMAQRDDSFPPSAESSVAESFGVEFGEYFSFPSKDEIAERKAAMKARAGARRRARIEDGADGDNSDSDRENSSGENSVDSDIEDFDAIDPHQLQVVVFTNLQRTLLQVLDLALDGHCFIKVIRRRANGKKHVLFSSEKVLVVLRETALEKIGATEKSRFSGKLKEVGKEGEAKFVKKFGELFGEVIEEEEMLEQEVDEKEAWDEKCKHYEETGEWVEEGEENGEEENGEEENGEEENGEEGNEDGNEGNNDVGEKEYENERDGNGNKEIADGDEEGENDEWGTSGSGGYGDWGGSSSSSSSSSSGFKRKWEETGGENGDGNHNDDWSAHREAKRVKTAKEEKKGKEAGRGLQKKEKKKKNLIDINIDDLGKVKWEVSDDEGEGSDLFE